MQWESVRLGSGLFVVFLGCATVAACGSSGTGSAAQAGAGNSAASDPSSGSAGSTHHGGAGSVGGSANANGAGGAGNSKGASGSGGCAGQCSGNAGSGTTSDGWAYYAAYEDQSSFGVRQHQPDLFSLLETRSGVLLGASSLDSWRSMDRGATWSKIGARHFVVDQLPTGELIALTDGQIEVSTDDGYNFSPVAVGDQPRVVSVAVQGSTIYAIDAAHIYKSDDAGKTFSIFEDSPNQVGPLLVDHYGTVYVISAGNAYRRRPHDDRWTRAPLANVASDVLELSNGTLLAAGDDGVERSVDFGASWQPATGVTTRVKRLLSTSKGAALALGVGGVFESSDGGQTFHGIGPTPAVSAQAGVVLDDDSVLIATSQPVTIYESPVITDALASQSVPPPLAASCFNGQLDSGETDIDCGPNCGECITWQVVAVGGSAEYVTRDGTVYSSVTSNSGDQLARTDLGKNFTVLGSYRLPLADRDGFLYAWNPNAAALEVSTDRGSTFTVFGPASLPGLPTALLASTAHDLTDIAIGDSIYSMPLAGGALSAPVQILGAGSFSKFFEAADHTLYALAKSPTANVYRANADASAWAPIGSIHAVALAEYQGTIYAGAETGVYRLDNTTFSAVTGADKAYGSTLGINSTGTLFFISPDGLVSCPLSGPNAGKDTMQVAATGLYLLTVLSDDRVFSQPYLSEPTSKW